jgi:hypothetical protein
MTLVQRIQQKYDEISQLVEVVSKSGNEFHSYISQELERLEDNMRYLHTLKAELETSIKQSNYKSQISRTSSREIENEKNIEKLAEEPAQVDTAMSQASSFYSIDQDYEGSHYHATDFPSRKFKENQKVVNGTIKEVDEFDEISKKSPDLSIMSSRNLSDLGRIQAAKSSCFRDLVVGSPRVSSQNNTEMSQFNKIQNRTLEKCRGRGSLTMIEPNNNFGQSMSEKSANSNSIPEYPNAEIDKEDTDSMIGGNNADKSSKTHSATQRYGGLLLENSTAELANRTSAEFNYNVNTEAPPAPEKSVPKQVPAEPQQQDLHISKEGSKPLTFNERGSKYSSSEMMQSGPASKGSVQKSQRDNSQHQNYSGIMGAHPLLFANSQVSTGLDKVQTSQREVEVNLKRTTMNIDFNSGAEFVTHDADGCKSSSKNSLMNHLAQVRPHYYPDCAQQGVIEEGEDVEHDERENSLYSGQTSVASKAFFERKPIAKFHPTQVISKIEHGLVRRVASPPVVFPKTSRNFLAHHIPKATTPPVFTITSNSSLERQSPSNLNYASAQKSNFANGNTGRHELSKFATANADTRYGGLPSSGDLDESVNTSQTMENNNPKGISVKIPQHTPSSEGGREVTQMTLCNQSGIVNNHSNQLASHQNSFPELKDLLRPDCCNEGPKGRFAQAVQRMNSLTVNNEQLTPFTETTESNNTNLTNILPTPLASPASTNPSQPAAALTKNVSSTFSIYLKNTQKEESPKEKTQVSSQVGSSGVASNQHTPQVLQKQNPISSRTSLPQFIQDTIVNKNISFPLVLNSSTQISGSIPNSGVNAISQGLGSMKELSPIHCIPRPEAASPKFSSQVPQSAAVPYKSLNGNYHTQEQTLNSASISLVSDKRTATFANRSETMNSLSFNETHHTRGINNFTQVQPSEDGLSSPARLPFSNTPASLVADPTVARPIPRRNPNSDSDSTTSINNQQESRNEKNEGKRENLRTSSTNSKTPFGSGQVKKDPSSDEHISTEIKRAFIYAEENKREHKLMELLVEKVSSRCEKVEETYLSMIKTMMDKFLDRTSYQPIILPEKNPQNKEVLNAMESISKAVKSLEQKIHEIEHKQYESSELNLPSSTSSVARTAKLLKNSCGPKTQQNSRNVSSEKFHHEGEVNPRTSVGGIHNPLNILRSQVKSSSSGMGIPQTLISPKGALPKQFNSMITPAQDPMHGQSNLHSSLRKSDKFAKIKKIARKDIELKNKVNKGNVLENFLKDVSKEEKSRLCKLLLGRGRPCVLHSTEKFSIALNAITATASPFAVATVKFELSLKVISKVSTEIKDIFLKTSSMQLDNVIHEIVPCKITNIINREDTKTFKLGFEWASVPNGEFPVVTLHVKMQDVEKGSIDSVSALLPISFLNLCEFNSLSQDDIEALDRIQKLPLSSSRTLFPNASGKILGRSMHSYLDDMLIELFPNILRIKDRLWMKVAAPACSTVPSFISLHLDTESSMLQANHFSVNFDTLLSSLTGLMTFLLANSV